MIFILFGVGRSRDSIVYKRENVERRSGGE